MSDQNPHSLAAKEPQVQISPVPVPLVVQYTQRTVTMHSVTGVELDTIASISNSVHLAFFGLSAGGAVSFGVVLSAGGIEDSTRYASYVALFAVSLIGSLYFGFRALIDYKKAKQKLDELKTGR